MHTEAMFHIFKSFHEWRDGRSHLRVLDIGSLDINGSMRPIFYPFAEKYIGIDAQDGPGVDIVTDATEYLSPGYFDVIICAEVFEHTPDWKKIINNSYVNLVDGGIFIATMAGEGRYPHSAIDENPIREWEHYSNIGWWELQQALKAFKTKEVNVLGTDTRCYAVK
jgi:hypothetical protein